ncbi:protein AATF [Takifugu flavidus]|nr:protein AATF [Takifugu flavidus]
MFLTSSLPASQSRARVGSFKPLAMASAFSQQLEELLNPLPKFHDPEDEDDEATKAKVIESFHEDDDEDENVAAPSALRKGTSGLLETDRRYVGKKVSRKQLLMDLEGSADSDDDTDEDGEQDDEDDGLEELAEEGRSEEADVESDGNDLDGDDEELIGSDAPLNSADLIFPREVDFHKLTDGMDELGVSEDDDTAGEETVDSDEAGGSDESEAEDEDIVEDEGAVQTFSQDKADEEVEKGKAVKNQLALWDQVLEGRIRIQKALVTANQLPQPQTFPDFKRSGGEKFASELKNAHKALKALQRSLLDLQDQLLFQKEETRAIALEKTAAQSKDMEIKSDDSQDEGELGQEATLPKRKLEMAEYPDFMAKRFAAFQPYQNATLQKWHDKTRLTAGKGGKGFGAFDRNILTQVEQVLLDRDRLVRRTQTQRSEYRILGKREAPALTPEIFTEGEEAERQLRANAHLKDLDEDIFDDDDFYHQLLRELIEHKTTAADPNDQVAMGRQWLTIQKLRSRIRKKVDTKASKGRKVKFQIHNKLVNFMAPVDHSTLGDKGRTELYRGLFGQTSTARE